MGHAVPSAHSLRLSRYLTTADWRCPMLISRGSYASGAWLLHCNMARFLHTRTNREQPASPAQP